MNKQVAVSNVPPGGVVFRRVMLKNLSPVAFPPSSDELRLHGLSGLPGLPKLPKLPNLPKLPSAAMLLDAKGFPTLAVPLSVSTHAAGTMRISRYPVDVSSVPVDFFADPDGVWDFDSLVESAGFDPEDPGVCIGALIADFEGHPAGAAVVTEVGRRRSYVAIVECPAERAASAEHTAAHDAVMNMGAVTRAA